MIISTTDIIAAQNRNVIPLAKGLPYTRQRVTLDGRAFLLDLQWNMRSETWAISLADAEGVPVASGISLVPNWTLLRYFKYNPACPPGELVAQDDGSGLPIGFDDIGGSTPRVSLLYYAIESAA